MVDHWLLRILLFPVSLLFGLGVALKNALYRAGLLTSVKFSVPVIAIGNLTVGGSGKTPHVEYLLRLLRPYVRTAVMSRGFGRKTTGFRFVPPQSQSTEAGDEPLIYARKYRDVVVSVSESRSIGIPQLLQHRPEVQVILLDDAFQHRSVKPHLNILLTEFSQPFYSDWLLPVGRLREWRNAYRRADIIVVTKCPENLQQEERDRIISKVAPLAHQTVYFSAYQYHHPYPMYPSHVPLTISEADSVLIVCGIARPEDLYAYVTSHHSQVDIIVFGDHHTFDPEDMAIIRSRYEVLPGTRKMILTTEKDAVRLEQHAGLIAQYQLPVYLLPVEVSFLRHEGRSFEAYIKDFLLDFRV